MMLISFEMTHCGWHYPALYSNHAHVSIKDGGQVGAQRDHGFGENFTLLSALAQCDQTGWWLLG